MNLLKLYFGRRLGRKAASPSFKGMWAAPLSLHVRNGGRLNETRFFNNMCRLSAHCFEYCLTPTLLSLLDFLPCLFIPQRLICCCLQRIWKSWGTVHYAGMLQGGWWFSSGMEDSLEVITRVLSYELQHLHPLPFHPHHFTHTHTLSLRHGIFPPISGFPPIERSHGSFFRSVQIRWENYRVYLTCERFSESNFPNLPRTSISFLHGTFSNGVNLFCFGHHQSVHGLAKSTTKGSNPIVTCKSAVYGL